MLEFSITETLFGGLLFAVFLFFSSRRLGLSNYWAGILSGALPFLVYLIYSSYHWPGGDVLTIHFAVFLATAGVLIAFGGMQRRKEKMHWAPKLLIIFFVSLVILNAVLLSISSRGLPDKLAGVFLPNPEHQKIHTVFPGVVPHDRNKLYEPHLQQVEKQKNLGWEVAIEGLEQLRGDTAKVLTIVLHDKEQQPIQGAKIRLGMWRMANSRDDRVYDFKEIDAGKYQVEVIPTYPGRWQYELYIEKGQDTYVKQQPLFIEGD